MAFSDLGADGICKIVASFLNAHGVEKKRRGRKSKSRKRKYIDVPCAFDIETSRIGCDADGNPNTIMYIWQLQLGLDCTIIGRYWHEFLTVIDNITRWCEEKEDNWHLVMYVHNLSHEFQYLAGIWNFEPGDVMAIRSRKVLRADMGRVELRCSMLHSNMSLAAFTKKMNAPHAKAVGDLDYSIVRYPWSPLSPTELTYCVNDVRGLVESIMIEMQRDGDTLDTIPATSTGYVRRDVKKAVYEYGIKHIQKLLPDFDLYKALREAFRGGDTHANRYYVGVKLENVKSIDMSSAYPAVQCQCRFPTTPFRKLESDFAVLRTELARRHAIVCRCAIWGMKQRDSRWGMPYVPLAKTRAAYHYVNDNGRLLEAEYLEITLTDIDLRIMAAEYTWQGMKVLDLWSAKYGYIPQKIQHVVENYFSLKTKLKGVDGQEYLYMKSKNKLNSVYGMTAQDPLPPNWQWNGEDFEDPEGDQEARYYENQRHLFLPYQWGVWTTAHTRRRLKLAQHAAGDGCVYCDTDSVKYVGSCDMTAYNTETAGMADFVGACAKDPKGIMHYMGVYENERPYAEFKTWGAKKYATTYEKGGPITTTIAGVNKNLGGEELAAAGGFDAFEPGYTFVKAAGKLIVYNDHPNMPPIIGPAGERVEVTRNLCICDNTHTVGITQEYAKLLGITAEKEV